MTILIGPTKAAALAAAGTENNPLVFWDNAGASGTYSTGVGTEVENAALAATGTTYDAWVATPSNIDRAALMIVLPSPQEVDCIAIAAHNIADIGGTVRFEYNDASGGGGTWQQLDVETPTDNQAIMAYFDGVTADYWRILLTDITEDVEIAVAFIGSVLTIPQRIYQGYTPPITPTNVRLQSNVSQGGNLLGAVVTGEESSASPAIDHVDPTFIRGADFKGLMKHFNEGNGVFWAWRPTKYHDLFFAWRDGGTIVPTNSGPKDLMSFNLNMRFHDEP